MDIVVLADTHITGSGRRRLNARVYRELEAADLILHAGDIVVPEVLEDLSRFAPVRAVLGNNDRGLEHLLPERAELTLGGVEVALVHDAGRTEGRPRRLRRWFPRAHVVCFGHSHIPVAATTDDGLLLLNPGSPTDKRRQSHHTVARLRIRDGAARATIVEIDE